MKQNQNQRETRTHKTKETKHTAKTYPPKKNNPRYPQLFTILYIYNYSQF